MFVANNHYQHHTVPGALCIARFASATRDEKARGQAVAVVGSNTRAAYFTSAMAPFSEPRFSNSLPWRKVTGR